MRKEVNLPKIVVKKLNKLANKKRMKTKPYMELVLIEHTESQNTTIEENNGGK